MKKTLLSLAIIATGFCAQSQVVVAGVSPAAIAGTSYPFAVQTDLGWPRYAANPFAPQGEYWGLAMDFAVPGTFVMDTLVLVNDGTPGTSATYGHLNGEEGCSPSPAGAYDGKIAVLRRGTCNFTLKAKLAQDQGAVAVIVVDHMDDPNLENNYMSSSDTDVDGPLVTIPVVRISKTQGNDIIAQMQLGPVVMFIGNKLGAFPNDVGAKQGEYLISPYGGSHVDIFNGFDLGIQLYNYGSLDQSNVYVTANINGPSGNVYNASVGPLSINSGDTLPIFNGNASEFPPFDLGGFGNYAEGDYTLSYDIDLGVADDLNYDNSFSSPFNINGSGSESVVSLAKLNAGMPVANSYPKNSTAEYQSCMFYEEQLTANGAMMFEGLYFTPYTDTAVTPLAGEEILINVYEWNDTWTDLTDPGPQTNNDWFTALNQIDFASYYPTSDNETGQLAYSPFSSVLQFDDNQRYLVCLQSFNPEVAFGYDNTINYDGNQGIFAMPISPVFVDDTWFTGGWTGVSASSCGLKVAFNSIKETSAIEGKAFPNPANDVVTISVNTSGNANITVTDISGKVAMNTTVILENGNTKVNIDALEPGVYVFNLEMENGLTSQFNVVKK